MLNRDNPLIALLLICAWLVTHKAWAANESDSTSPVITSLHVAKSPTFFGRELFPDECLTDEQCGRNSRCHLRTCSCNYGFIKAERYGQQKCLGTHKAECKSSYDCQAHLMCLYASPLDDFAQCVCSPEKIYIPSQKGCFEKVDLYSPCEFDEQCSELTPFSICQPSSSGNKFCECRTNFRLTPDRQCRVYYRKDGKRSALEIYKITMIFASCCLALILLLFLGCVIRRAYCGSPQLSPLDNTVPDIFTLFPESGGAGGSPPFNITPPYDKPPSYDESERQIRQLLGDPPPCYPETEHPNPSSPHVDIGEAGPSGEGHRSSTSYLLQESTSRELSDARVRGVDNRAFDVHE